jgi:hypothetical protein
VVVLQDSERGHRLEADEAAVVGRHRSLVVGRAFELHDLNMLQLSISDGSAQRQSLEVVEEIVEPGVRLQSECRVDVWVDPLELSVNVFRLK